MGTSIRIWVNGKEHGRHRKPRLRWTIGPVSEQQLPGPGDVHMASVILRDTQQVPIEFEPEDKKQFAAIVEGVTFQSSDTSIATVMPDADNPMKALVVAGAPGQAQVSIAADAIVGPGESMLLAVLDVTVVAGQAVTLGIAVGVPEEQPESVPVPEPPVQP